MRKIYNFEIDNQKSDNKSVEATPNAVSESTDKKLLNNFQK